MAVIPKNNMANPIEASQPVELMTAEPSVAATPELRFPFRIGPDGTPSDGGHYASQYILRSLGGGGITTNSPEPEEYNK